MVSGANSTLRVTMEGDISAFTRAMRNASAEVGQFERSTVRSNDAAGVSFGKLVGAISLSTIAVSAASDAVGALGSQLRASIGAASDLAESQSKVGVVFGESAGEIRAWGADAAVSLGMSTQAALEAAATIGNFAQALGISAEQARVMSPAVVQLAADLASFNNASPEETLLALRSGLSGEAEPLRRFGVAINAAAVESKALEMGLEKVNGQLTEGAKVQARYALIMEQTKTAQGDFARTADGLANSTRTLSGVMDDLRAKVGEGVAPALAEAVAELNTWMTSDQGIEFTNDLATAMGGLASLSLDAAAGIAEVTRMMAEFSGFGGFGIIGDLQAARDSVGGLQEFMLRFASPEVRALTEATRARAGQIPRAEGMTDAEIFPEGPVRIRSKAERMRLGAEGGGMGSIAASEGLLAAAAAEKPEDRAKRELEARFAEARLWLDQVAPERNLPKKAGGGLSELEKAAREEAERIREGWELANLRQLQLVHKRMEEAEIAAAEATKAATEAVLERTKAEEALTEDLQSRLRALGRFTGEGLNMNDQRALLQMFGFALPESSGVDVVLP